MRNFIIAILFTFGILSLQAQANYTDPAAINVAMVPSVIAANGTGQIKAIVSLNPVAGSTSNLPAGKFKVIISILGSTAQSLINFTTSPYASASNGTASWSVLSSDNGTVILLNTVNIPGDATSISIYLNIKSVSATAGAVTNGIGLTANVTAPAGGYGDPSTGNNSTNGDITVSASMPITLVNFAASKSGNSALISWTTAQESNVSHFAVERSATGDAGGAWTTIGTVLPTNTSVLHDYQLSDNAPLSGDNFYRLKSIDKDGTSATSKTVSLNFTNGGFLASLYPSPVKQSATLKIGGDNHGSYIVTITDISGKQIGNVVKMNGGSSSILELTNLPAGSYILGVKDAITGAKLSSQLFIKQ